MYVMSQNVYVSLIPQWFITLVVKQPTQSSSQATTSESMFMIQTPHLLPLCNPLAQLGGSPVAHSNSPPEPPQDLESTRETN